MRSWLKVINILLLVLFIGVAIYFLIRDSQELSEIVIRLNPWLVLVSFVIVWPGTLLAVFAWRQILAAHDLSFSLIDDIQIYCYSQLGTAVPGRIWTIVGRTTFYQQVGGESIRVISASLLETLLTGIASMLIYALITAARPEISLWKNQQISLVLAISMLVFFNPRLFRWLFDKVYRLTQKKTPPSIKLTYLDLTRWIAYEGIVVLIGGVAVFALLSSFTPVSKSFLLPVLAAWAAGVSAGTLFFWLPGTPLLRDGALVLALSTQMALPLTIAFAILARFWSILTVLLMAGLVWAGINLSGKGNLWQKS